MKAKLITLSSVFQGWYHAAKFVSLKRKHRRLAKQIRNSQFAEVVESAARAAEKHDTHTHCFR